MTFRVQPQVTPNVGIENTIMKKIFKFIGIGLLGIVIFFAVIVATTMIGSIDKEEVFIPYIEFAVPRLTTWNIAEYETLMSKEGFEACTEEQMQLYLTLFSRLGTLESMGIPELQGWRNNVDSHRGRVVTATYLVPLTFDTGEAHVELGLQHLKGKTEICSVNFKSDLLIQ